MSNCKYYFVTVNGCNYFKYTRSIEHFENDNLFQCLKIKSKEFIEFLKKKSIYSNTNKNFIFCS